MPFTNEEYLPTPQELETEEINVSSAPLRAAAHHMGKYCDNQSKEYMLCMRETDDPRKCLKEGKDVTNCGLEFFRKLKSTCAAEYTEYWNCLDHSWWNMDYKNCRKSQGVYDTCMLEKFGQERPERGFFSKVRVHNTNRAKPIVDVPLPERVPDAPDYKKAPVPESVKLGTRFYSSSS